MNTLLLVHAFPVDATMWEGQIEALSGEAAVLAPNLPGFGGTPAAGDVMTMDAAADFLAGELDRAGAERAVVCGLSVGGYIAFSFWRKYRSRVSGLILADARAEADDEAGAERRRGLAQKLRAEGNGMLVESPPPLLSESADPQLWDQVKNWISKQPAESIAAAALGIAERPDSTGDLAGIDVPTTVIVGSADTLTPPPMSETIAAGIPGAELVTLEGAGHLSNLEDPEGFNAAVRALLARTS